MITLTNGHIQNASSIFVPNGSIVFQLNVDATVLAAPGGFVCAEIPIVFQLDANGNLIQPAQLYSNEELNPQNSSGLGTYYLVTVYTQAGARLNAVPMWWQFQEAAGATVDISTMAPTSTVGGNVIFYPSFFNPAPFSSNNVWTGTNTFGTVNAKNFENILFADQFAGADWAAQVQAADTALGAGAGEIWVNGNNMVINACAVMFTLSPYHTLRFLTGGTYSVSSTLKVPTGGKIIGPNATSLPETGGANIGVTIQALPAFTVTTPVILISDASHTEVSVNVDGNGVTGVVGIQYTSTNTPGSSYTNIGFLSVKGCHIALCFGDLAASASTNNYQADVGWVHDIQIFGADAAAEGVRINSQNAADQMTMERMNIQSVSIGVHIIKGPVQTLQLKHINTGNPVGSKVAFQFDATNVVSPDLIGCEVEGAWTSCVTDHSTNSTPYSAMWQGNQFNTGTVTIDGKQYITAIGNTGGAPAAWTVSGTAFVFSSMEVFTMWAGNVSGITVNNANVALLGQAVISTFDGTTPSGTKGVLVTRTGATAGTLYFGDGSAFISMASAGVMNLNAGVGATWTIVGSGSSLQTPAVLAAANLSTASIAATRMIDSEPVLNFAGSVTITGSVAAVRGNTTIAAGTTISSGFVYGTQGKITAVGTLASANFTTGVVGQLDFSAITALSGAGPISCIWGDCGASITGSITTAPNLNVLHLTNTTACLINAAIFVETKSTYLLDISNASYSPFLTTTAPGTAYGRIAINTPAGIKYIGVYNA